jgi:glycosyltransferase involved in cell wall biosynthesis
MTSNDRLVSIIIRTVYEKRLHLLCKSISSVFENSHRPIEVVIVAQTENDDFLEKIETTISRFIDSDFKTSLIVNQTTKDERAKNLNLGIRQAGGRYIGFLDDDDVIYPNHISLLIEALSQSEETVWAYSDVAAVVCDVDIAEKINIISIDRPYIKDKFSKETLWKDNFIPIHSYIIDQERLKGNVLEFDESLKVMEDYAFILRLASYYEPKYIPIVTCEYRFYTDASNSNYYVNQLLGINYTKKVKVWREASFQIEEIKRNLMPEYSPGIS